MKKIMTFGLLVAGIVLYGMTAQAATFPVTRVIEVPGATKAELMDKVSTWAGSYAKTSKVDAKTGVVSAKGEISYPSPPVDRIQYTIAFEMKNTVKGNKNTVTFDNVMLKAPANYLSESGEVVAGTVGPIKSERDKAAAAGRLTYVADNLEAFLQGKSAESCPLVKCPECAVLCPTSEEMKEHMKTHEQMKEHSGHEMAPEK